MKSLTSILLVIVLFSLQNIKSQEEESWVYRVNFEETQEMADSTLAYTNVYVAVNSKNLQDSLILVFTISSSFGANDILLKKLVYTSALIGSNDIVQTNDAVSFYLGKYAIKPEIPFIVDFGFEYR